MTYLLDTSAVVAYLADETGGDRVRAVKRTAALPFVVLTELYYVMRRKHDQALAERIVQDVLTWKLPILYPDQRISLYAGYLKARDRLGLADSFIAAFALIHHATLVTKDPDFKALHPDLVLLFLE